MTSNAPKESLSTIFRPEFLNRLDEILEFEALGKDEIREIVKLQIADFAKRLSDNQLSLKVDDKALELIAERGYDPAFGARPVKRTIQRELENPIAKAIIAGHYPPGASISVTVKDGEIEFEK
jgi:ATP-dependent Clp protease ATP-binding subunit ClpB